MNRRIAMTALAVVVAIALSLGAVVTFDSEAGTAVMNEKDVRWETIGGQHALIVSGDVFGSPAPTVVNVEHYIVNGAEYKKNDGSRITSLMYNPSGYVALVDEIPNKAVDKIELVLSSDANIRTWTNSFGISTEVTHGTIEIKDGATTAIAYSTVVFTLNENLGFPILKSLTVNGSDEDVTYNAETRTGEFVMPWGDVAIKAEFDAVPPTPYEITYGTFENGNVTGAESAIAGEKVTLTVTPDTGYKAASVKYNDVPITPVDGVYSFNMPAENVEITATFEIIDYNITYGPLSNGKVTGQTTANYNEKVELEVTPDEGYEVDTVEFNGTAITPEEGVYSFTMPAEDVTVTATFKMAEYQVAIGDIEHGTVTADKTVANFGDKVVLTVTPADGYKIKSVEVDGTAITPVDGEYSFTMPAKDVEITAAFETIIPYYPDGTVVKNASGKEFTIYHAMTMAGEVQFGIAIGAAYYNGEDWAGEFNNLAVESFDSIYTSVSGPLSGMIYNKDGDSCVDAGIYSLDASFNMNSATGAVSVKALDLPFTIRAANLADAELVLDSAPLYYNGETQVPGYTLTFNGTNIGPMVSTIWTDSTCEVEANPVDAAKYYLRINSDNPNFEGSVGAEFEIGKALSGLIAVELKRSDESVTEYYWTANAYGDAGFPNISVVETETPSGYILYISTTGEFAGSGESYANLEAVQAAIAAFDDEQTGAYTMYVKIVAQESDNYASESKEIGPIDVGDVSRKITGYVDEDEPGNKVTPSPMWSQKGKQVELSVALADNSYRLSELKVIGDVTGAVIKPVLEGEVYVFEMIDENVTVQASFEKLYMVTFPEELLVTAGDASIASGTYVSAGTEISVKAPAGTKFSDDFKLNGEAVSDLKVDTATEKVFVMPSEDVRISVTLKGNLTVIFVEDGYSNIKYPGNASGNYCTLPFPAAHECWELIVNGESVTYAGGSVYIVNSDHQNEAGEIVFTAVNAPITTATVTFVFGSHIQKCDVPLGALAVPDEVKKAAMMDGYDLDWYCDDKIITEETEVYDGMIVIAQYTAIPVEPTTGEVVFVYGSQIQRYVLPLGALFIPDEVKQAAMMDGYTMVWMYNNEPISDNTTVTDGMILVAEYTPKPKDPSQNMTVTLKSMDGGIQYSITALDGNAVPSGVLKVYYTHIVVINDRSYAIQDVMDVSVNADGYSEYQVGSIQLLSNKNIVSLIASFQYSISGTEFSESSAIIFL